MNKPKFIMLCGLPGSGKSTYCDQYKDDKNYVIISSDSVREELGDINDQSKNTEVFKIVHNKTKEALKNGYNVIQDCTSLNRKRRIHFIRHELKDILCEKVCMLFATPYETCLKNNANRDRKVPEDVIKRMVKSFEVPCKQEGWDDIQIVWWDYRKEFNIYSDLLKWKKLSHNNIHHSLSVGDHMINAAYYNYCNYPINYKLHIALLMHDCGKPFTKSYVDRNGNKSVEAHYYQHENVSSYMSLFYLKDIHPKRWTDDDILEVALLINLHMRPLNAWDQSGLAKEKDRELFGDKIIKELEIINECDKAAQ